MTQRVSVGGVLLDTDAPGVERVVTTLTGWGSAPRRLSMDDILPRGVWCRFDTNQLLRDDFAARMAAYKVAAESGVYTLDELRAMERGRPMEDDSL